MLGIILFILKLLGILLLVILGLILLILILVLFAPIKYSGAGSRYGENLRIWAMVTYLNPVVCVTVQYPDAHIVKVKICGFTVFSTGEDDESKEENISEEKVHAEAETKEKEKHSFESNSIAEQKCQHKGSQEGSEAKEEGSSQSSGAITAGEPVVSADICQGGAETENTVSDTKDSKTESGELFRDIGEEKSFSDNPETGTSEDSTKGNVLDTVGYYASLFQENKGLILNVLKTVLNALKTILPRKCRIKAVFGTGEADKTGFIYAAYCALEDYLPGEIIFEPVWTEKFAEGEFALKGKIRLIHFLVAAIKIIANKNVRLLIKKIRRV